MWTKVSVGVLLFHISFVFLANIFLIISLPLISIISLTNSINIDLVEALKKSSLNLKLILGIPRSLISRTAANAMLGKDILCTSRYLISFTRIEWMNILDHPTAALRQTSCSLYSLHSTLQFPSTQILVQIFAQSISQQLYQHHFEWCRKLALPQRLNDRQTETKKWHSSSYITQRISFSSSGPV